MGASLRQHPGKSRSLILRVRCTAGWSAVTSHVDSSKAVKCQDPRAVLCGCRGLAEGRSAAWTLGEMCGAPLPRLELLADLGPYNVPPGPTGRPGWCDQAPAQAPRKGVRARTVILTPGIKLMVPQAGEVPVHTEQAPDTWATGAAFAPSMDHVAQEQPPFAARAFFPWASPALAGSRSCIFGPWVYQALKCPFPASLLGPSSPRELWQLTVWALEIHFAPTPGGFSRARLPGPASKSPGLGSFWHVRDQGHGRDAALPARVPRHPVMGPGSSGG